MFDWLAVYLGSFLKFIYDIAFHNYGLAIIIFTLIVRLAMLPLTVKQYKSTAKMQEIQPLINDIQKRYKDDKEMLNKEMMKVYQEHNYNPASGCLPMVIQLPIIFTLYSVIVRPMQFMLGKTKEQITTIINAAATGQASINAATNATLNVAQDKLLPETVEKVIGAWRNFGEIKALNFFHEHQDALPQVGDILKKADLIDFRSFLGLHLGEIANPMNLFSDWKIQLPLLILVILATVTTYISSKLTMPKTNTNQSNPAAGCSTNSMLYIGPVMTLMFSFQMPAGVILYWMAGYAVGIVQQLYVNKYVLKKNAKPAIIAADGKNDKITDGTALLEENNGTIDNTSDAKAAEKKEYPSAGSKNKGGSGKGKKGGNKKGGKRK